MKNHAVRDPRDENNLIIYDFSVTDFGAVADSSPDGGGTDNTDAFKNALDAAKKAGGGVVYVPAGFYRVDGKILSGAALMHAGLSFRRHFLDGESLVLHIEEVS